jgi:hypothetical protein
VAVPGSEIVLLNLPTLGATNHNGGALNFGPDGKQYAAVADRVFSFEERLETKWLSESFPCRNGFGRQPGCRVRRASR